VVLQYGIVVDVEGTERSMVMGDGDDEVDDVDTIVAQKEYYAAPPMEPNKEITYETPS